MKPHRIVCLLALLGSLVAGEAVPTPRLTVPPLDEAHAELAAVLRASVRADGVDYGALRDDRAALDRYRAQLAAAPQPTDRDGTLTLFINAYNACTLALVVDKLPADRAGWAAWSIKDAGGALTSVWKAYTFEVAGRRYSLDEMEHAVLRPLGEPRIHVAINCASRSCPPLHTEPFRRATLDAQLEAVTRAFVASSYHVRLDGGELRINPILDWFGEDFRAAGGVRAWLRAKAAPGPVADQLAGSGKLRFFDYDWRLNLAGVAP